VEGVTLDAGALIAADRNDRRFWIWWKWHSSRSLIAEVPAPALAQAWRGSRSARLAAVLAGCRIMPMEAEGARRAGQVCGVSNSSDVVDAFMVVSAAASGNDILTSDPRDLHRLAIYAPGAGRIRVLSELAH